VPKHHDMTGQRHHSLLLERHVGSDAVHSALWECLCDCGKRCVVSRMAMTHEHVYDCGCGIAKKVTCEWCGAVSVRSKIGARFCSKKCGQNAYNANRPIREYKPVELEDKACEECGEIFKPTRKDMRFCCVEHKWAFNSRKRECVQSQRKCSECGKVFVRQHRRVTCSKECGKIRNRRMSKLKYAPTGKPRGKNSKVNLSDAIKMREQGATYKQIAVKYGVSRQFIQFVVTREIKRSGSQADNHTKEN